MGAAKKLEMFPDEKYLADAIKDGRATRQLVSMKALGKPDTRLQAREQHLDMDHVRMLAEILERDGQLSPAVVFRDKAGKLWLADGFHRHEVYRRAGKAGFPAWQIDGEFRDAIEYATMCNRRLCLARKPGDIRKAIEILLADDSWFERADAWIGDHVGCCGSTVGRVRELFCKARGIEVPRSVKTRGEMNASRKNTFPRITQYIANGSARYKVAHGPVVVGVFSSIEEAQAARNAASARLFKPEMGRAQSKGFAYYRASIAGKNHYLGADPEAAQAKLDRLWEEHRKTLAQQPSPPPADPPDVTTPPKSEPVRCPHCGHHLPGWSRPR